MSGNFFYNAFFNYLKLESISFGQTSEDPNMQVIGYYDNSLKIWYNAWAICDSSGEKMSVHKKSKELVIYGLNLENDLFSVSNAEKMMIKSIICNSKIFINDMTSEIDYSESLQMQIILSVICYLTKAKKIKSSVSNSGLIIFKIEV